MKNDADEIRRALDDRLESVLDHFYSGWVGRSGKGYLTPKNAKDLGSFQVNLRGPRRGQWYRFSQRIGGGSVELISYATTGNIKAYDIAFREARSFLGISDDHPDDEMVRARRDEEAKRAHERRSVREAEEAKRRARRAETASEIWTECTSIIDTPAEQYLRGRGLPEPPKGWPDVLGFHRGLEYELGAEWVDKRKARSGPTFPCLVARVDDVAGEVTAIWRIFIDPLTGGKASVETPKLGLGPAKGGAVRIGGVAKKIGVAEGIETALGVRALIARRYPVWACLSTSGMAGVELPLEVESVTIFPDGDQPIRREGDEYVPAEAPGTAAARKLRDKLTRLKIKSCVAEVPFPGKDYLDVYLDSIR